jgi:polyisoprenoid-binding protein YceI
MRKIQGWHIAAMLILVVGLSAPIAHSAVLRLPVDTQKSQIEATVKEPLARLRDEGTVTGNFRILSGEIDGDPADVASTGHVKIVIDATSYDSGNLHRDKAVLSSALETRLYQSITFESTRIEKIEIDAPLVSGHAVVVGYLTLHGTTRQISVPASVSRDSDGTVTARGNFTFNYTDYGVNPPRLLFMAPAGDEVEISFHVIAAPPSSTAQ